jgi:hypothetical protein
MELFDYDEQFDCFYDYPVTLLLNLSQRIDDHQFFENVSRTVLGEKILQLLFKNLPKNELSPKASLMILDFMGGMILNNQREFT